MANNPPTPERQQSLLDKDSENVRQESSDNENGDVQTSVLPNEGVQTEQEEMQLQPEQSQIPIESVTAKPGHSYEETRSETYGSYEQLSSSTKDGTESSYYSPPELSEELQTEQEKDKPQIPIPPIPQHSSDEPEIESLTSVKQQPLLRRISAALFTGRKERKHTLLEEPRIEIDPIQPVAGPSGTIPISEETNIDSPIPSSSTATSPSIEPPRYPISPDVEKKVPPAGHNPDSYSYTPSSSEWTAEHVREQIGRTDSLFGFPSLPDIGSTTTLEVKRERVERRRAAGQYTSWFIPRPGAPPTATDEDEDRRPYPDWIRWIEMRIENAVCQSIPGWSLKKKLVVGGIAAIALAAIIAAIVILTSTSTEESGGDGTANVTKEALVLEDLLRGRLASRSLNATWISSTELLYRDTERNVVVYDVTKRNTTIVLEATEKLSIDSDVNGTNTSVLYNAFTVEFSPDRKYLLIGYNRQEIFRYSYLALYVIVDLTTKETYEVGGRNSTNQYIPQLVVWSTTDNAYFYVINNNIYYKSSVSTEETVTITNDGVPKTIYNGIPDWVYEEEVLSSNKALWPSPDGKKLVFAKFNDTQVQEIAMEYYGEPGQLSWQYPIIRTVRYPKPGTPNPIVSLHLVDLNTTEVETLEIPSEIELPILASVVWTTNFEIVAVWMNRTQNKAALTYYNTQTSNMTTIRIFEDQNGWLELFTQPIVSNSGTQLLMVLSLVQPTLPEIYRHIGIVNIFSGTVEAITEGSLVVKEIIGWDYENDLVYYHATAENRPDVQHVYSIHMLNTTVNCLSCDIRTSLKNESCLYNSAAFSTDFSYYALTCDGPGVPEISLYSSKNRIKLETWENNEELLELIEDKLIPITQTFTVPLEDDFEAYVQLKLPPNLDRSGDTKYPMIVNVYGGPDSYQVTQKFGLDWGSYLTSNKSIIYALIDGRGSGMKSDRVRTEIYRNIGTVEVEDQIIVTRHIQENYPYVDATRTAIWGWSYGGYVAGMALANDTDGVFKCGISVAPVTDWFLYDSIYTERYMGLPTVEDNLKGYAVASLLNRYEGIRGKEYLLIHGSYDDNVHYQQSMLWAKTLERNDILFRQQSYTDENHSLSYVRPHLYHTMETFLDECFIQKSKSTQTYKSK